MFEFIKKSLKAKLLLLTGVVLIVTSIAIIVFSAKNARDIAKENAKNLANVEAEKFISSFKSIIEEQLLLVRNLADIYSAVNSPTNPVKFSRVGSNNMVKELIERNKNIFGIYVSWVPDNSFDGMDKIYAQMPNNPPSGRYTIYYVRFKDGVREVIERSYEEEWEEEYNSDYFAKPRDKGIECIIDPYLYDVEGDSILMISLTAPIVNNKRFYGIVGVDITVDFIQKYADKLDLFEKTGKISIIANDGNLVGGTGYSKYVGINVDSIDNFSQIKNISELVSNGKGQDTIIGNNIELLVPIYFGKTDTPWAAHISVPLEVPLKEANKAITTQIIVSIFLIIIGLFLIFWFVNKTTKPILQLVTIANNIKDGIINERIDINSNDEIGVLANAFSEMSQKIRNIITEINNLGENLHNGKLDYRATTDGFSGAYAELINNINDAINNIVRPLNVAAEYIDRISKGDVPPKIIDEYKGDFNEIKNNINQCIDAINLLIKDTYDLAEHATNGRLNERAKAERHQGDFRRLVQGINSTLDRLVGLIDNMPIPVRIVDKNNNVLYENNIKL